MLGEFRKVVDRVGQAEIHRKTGLSRAAISQVYNNKYGASTDEVIRAVLEKCGGVEVEQIPEGYRKDGQGNLVRVENIKDIDIARDELVQEIVGRAGGLQSEMREFKQEVMGDIAAFVELAMEKYKAPLGGKKGNVTLRSFDHKYKVQLAISEHLVFDERLQAARALVNSCIIEWAEGSTPEIKTLVNSAFQTDKEGRINTTRVLGLRRLNIKDEKWRRAMDAISDSLTVAGSRAYVRIYERDDETGAYAQIPLDMATL